MVYQTTVLNQVCEIDPLHDERWPRFLDWHKRATIYHTREWLNALTRTYGYGVAVVTSSPQDEELTNALVFCRVRSWLTGSRIVSVPFSDHCEPLVETPEELSSFLSNLKSGLGGVNGQYIEVRPCLDLTSAGEELVECGSFCHHNLDLHADIAEIFHGFDADCVRRKIRRAEKAGLIYEEGRSDELVQKLYNLAVLTRRRHGVPPQPLTWFRNLVACMGEKLKIRMVSTGPTPAAAIITLQYKDTMVYKYGYSDARFHRMGSMQLLMWKAIQDAKNSGFTSFDLGRSDWTNPGLIRFKDRWGAKQSALRYWRYPGPKLSTGLRNTAIRVARGIFACAPERLLVTAGNILYPHIG